jgi:hypothetical protein
VQGLWVAAGLAGCLGVCSSGCSSSERLAPSPDAARDTGARPEAGTGVDADAVSPDAARDSGRDRVLDAARDSTADVADDAGLVCPHVVGAADCAPSNSECRPTWTDVLADPICPHTTPPTSTGHESRFDCDGYHVSLVGHIDTATYYIYDATSGQLVAIYADNGLWQTCLAGPPSGVKLDCPTTAAVSVCTADGGATSR